MLPIYKKAFSATFFAAFLMGSAASSQDLAPYAPLRLGIEAYRAPEGEFFRIPRNGVAQINRHSQCRRVKNNGSDSPVMIPVQTAAEWSGGPFSFLQSDTIATVVGPCYYFQVIWLLDASGSMAGERVQRGKDLIEEALTEAASGSVPYAYLRNAAPVAGDYFFTFDERATYHGKGQRGNVQQVEALKDIVQAAQTTVNTNIPQALSDVFDAARAGGIHLGMNKPLIIMVSDGISNNENIDPVMAANDDLGIPVYAFDIEPPINAVMARIATYAGTTYTREDINSVLESIFSARSVGIDNDLLN